MNPYFEIDQDLDFFCQRGEKVLSFMQSISFEPATKGRYRGRVGDETALSISYFSFQRSIRHLHIVLEPPCILFLGKTVMLIFTISAY